MNLVRFFETQSAAMEAYLPSIEDEDVRMDALRYLRGIQTVLDSAPSTGRSNLIDFQDRRLDNRVKAATHSYRGRQLAAANRQLAAASEYLQLIRVAEYGWDKRDEID